MPLANKPNPEPLPPCPQRFPPESDLQRAYQVCKALEPIKQWTLFHDDLAHNRSEEILLNLTPVIVARVLGFFLLYCPSDSGRVNLATEILGCDDDHELLAGLAHLYVYGLIRVFYNPKANTPNISIDQSPELSRQEAAAKLEHLLEKPSLNAKELRKLVMAREDGHCPITGRADETVLNSETEPDNLHLTHIISQSFSQGIEGGSQRARKKFTWSKTAEAIIEHFGGFSTRALLGSENLQSPQNAMLLSPNVHKFFDELNLWLTPFEDHGNVIADKYKVNFACGTWGRYFRSTITFRTHTFPSGRKIEPPSPQLIALHAACAQIAHMSGAAEHLEETFRDTDSIRVMTATPNAAQELVRALRKVQLQHLTRPVYAKEA